MSCPHYNIDIRGKCLFCGEAVTENRPRSNWNEPISPFDMARAIKTKQERDNNRSITPNSKKTVEIENHLEYSICECPKCKYKSLVCYPSSNIYECLNLKCQIKGKLEKGISGEYQIILSEIVDGVKDKSLATTSENLSQFESKKATENIPANSINEKPQMVDNNLISNGKIDVTDLPRKLPSSDSSFSITKLERAESSAEIGKIDNSQLDSKINEHNAEVDHQSAQIKGKKQKPIPQRTDSKPPNIQKLSRSGFIIFAILLISCGVIFFLGIAEHWPLILVVIGLVVLVKSSLMKVDLVKENKSKI
jgi:hypothetical protein